MAHDNDNDTRTLREGPPRWKLKTAAVSPRGTKAVDARVSEPIQPTERFEIGDELGRGGMGSVVAAVDRVLERDVAIKHALTDDDKALLLFQREAKITAQLEHPSIVPVHDAGMDQDGRPYYVMRRLAGEPLAEHVQRRARDVKARLALVPNVLAAVDAAAFAHARDIIHRDIKPWNILIGDYGETVLIDWGLAHRLDDPDQDAGRAVGTPGYMAPEQVRGERLDARADVYALGATLLHVLTGEPTVVDASATEWMQRVAAGERPPLDKIDREVPVELVAIVAKAMAPERAARYADAREMAADLRAFLAGQLVAAHDYTPVERIVRFVRKHRVAVATASIALVAISAVGVLAVRNVLRERDIANTARLQTEQERRLAADRAELMLVERASSIASQDPARAVALLRTLPAGSRYMTRARDIASKAAAAGIAHGTKQHEGLVRGLAFAPDGRRLASTGKDGRLIVHNVVTGTSEVVVRRDGDMGPIAWVDNGASIVFSVASTGLFVLDTTTDRVRELDADVVIREMWAPGDDHRIRVHTNQQVLEYSSEGGVPVVLARDVDTVVYDGDAMLVVSHGTLRVFDQRGEREVMRHPVFERFLAIAFSPASARAAVATLDGRVIEFDLATKQERMRWELVTAWLYYAGDRLYASHSGREGALTNLDMNGQHETARGEWSTTWWSTAEGGHVGVNQSGTIVAIDPFGVHTFPQPDKRTRVIAGTRGRSYIAYASLDGWIRWLDLRAMTPRSGHAPSGAQLCSIDDTHVYFTSVGEQKVVMIPRSGAQAMSVRAIAARCLGALGGNRLVAYASPDSSPRSINRVTVVEAQREAVREFDARLLAASRETIVFVADASTVKELASAAGDVVTRYVADAEILTVHTEGAWISLLLADQRLLRVNRTTNEIKTTRLPGLPQLQAIDETGAGWITLQGRLYRVDDTGLHGVADVAADARGLYVITGLAGIVVEFPDRVERVTEAGVVSILPLTSDRSIGGGARVAASVDAKREVTLSFLDTGEQIVRRSQEIAAVLGRGTSLAVVRGRSNPVLELYDDPVPADPAQLHAWIDKATNAVLDPTTHVLQWR